ncbi:MAG: hypothetical protein LBE71_05665 [Dysgonamonadaceae bacterium]|jgi:hypothetical protein|nr:hypothetical protein [Dysgonamonadaceae bacterium]
MAKNRKKKKAPVVHRSAATATKPSKSFLDAHLAMLRRILRATGEDPAALDVFTKRQKQEFFRVVSMPPRVAAMRGYMVPRPFIRYVQDMLIKYLKRKYFNEKEGITWMDMATTGFSVFYAFNIVSFRPLFSEQQWEVVRRINRTFEKQNIYIKLFDEITSWIRTSLMMLSQPAFRIYGFEMSKSQQVGSIGFCQMIYIVTHESQSILFNYHNMERRAYRMAIGRCMNLPYKGATISIKKLYPNIEKDRMLDIYIQSHAIFRFKERIDMIDPVLRNQFFVFSLMFKQVVVTGSAGLPLISCIAPVEGVDDKPIGYFVPTVDNDNLLVLTILPLLSQSVPEGRILYERLHLSTSDLKYLGMDKLSFFCDVDIAQIPALKRVLFDELHLEYIRVMYSRIKETDRDAPFDETKTLFVKNFFLKQEEYMQLTSNEIPESL